MLSTRINHALPTQPTRLGLGRRVVVGVGAWLGYGLAFWLLRGEGGVLLGALASLPVALMAVFFGLRGGLLAGLACLPVNLFLYSLAGAGGWDKVLQIGGAPTALALTVAGALVGCLSDQRSHHQRAAQALHELEDRYRFIVAHAADVIWVLDVASQRFTFVSDSVMRLRGYTPAEVMAQPVDAALTPESAERIKRVLAERIPPFLAGLPMPVSFIDEVDQPCRDGSVVPTEVTSSYRLTDEGGLEIVGVSRDISKRKRAEAAARESQATLAAVVDSTADLIWSVDPLTFDLLTFNHGLVEYFRTRRGLSIHVGMSLIAMCQGDKSVQRWRGFFRQALQNGAYTTEYNTLDGSLTFQLTFNLLRRGDKVFAISVFGQDITSRKAAERATQMFQMLAAHTADLILFVRRADGRVLEANAAALRAYGYTRDELPGLTIHDLRAPDTHTQIARQMHQAERSSASFETVHRRRDGSTFPVEVSSQGAVLEGEPVLLSIVRDITERLQAQAALVQSEARFSGIFARSPIPITLTRLRDGVYLDANDAFLRLSGYTRAEVVQHTALELNVYPDPRTRVALLQTFREQGRVQSADQPFRTKTGEVVDTRLWLEPMTVGGEACVLALAMDVTEQRQAEARLRTLSYAVEQNPASIVITDTDGRIQYVNRKFSQLTGYSLEEARGQNPRLLKSGETSSEAYGQLWQTILAGGVWRGEFHNRKKSGELYWESATIAPMVDAAGHVTSFLAIKEDITEQKAAQAALRQSEQRYRGLFEGSPIIMWEEDLSAVKQRLASLPLAAGETLPDFLAARPDVVAECAGLISVIDANSAALQRYGASSREALLNGASQTFGPDLDAGFQEELVAIAAGRTALHREGANRTLDGVVFPVHVSWSALPGYEASLARVIVSIVDVTEQVQAEAALKQRLDELEAVNRVSTALRAAQRLDEMLPLLVREAVAIVGGSAGSLWLCEPATGEVALAYQDHWPLAGQRLQRGEDVPGYVAVSGLAHLTNDLASDERVPAASRALVAAGTGALCVPIRAPHEISGALYITTQPPRTFLPADVHLLTTLAEIAGNAIHRMRLHEQTEQRLSRLTALRAIDLVIGAGLDLPITLQVLIDHVMGQLQVDAADVLLLEAPSARLTFAAGRGFCSETAHQTTWPLGQGFAGRLALDLQPVALPAGADAPSHAGQLPAGEGFCAYYGVPLMSGGHLTGVLEVFHRAPLRPDLEWLEFLQALAGQAAIAIDNAQLFHNLQRSNADLTSAYEATLEGWSRALDLRDKETEGHSQRVMEMTLELATAYGLPEEQLVHLRRGALLHDIGKMGVPDRILLKPGPLTDDEWVLMQLHPRFAHDLLAPIEHLRPALDIPYCHHEKWDGTGYPRGLKGEEIPLAARLFAVADVYDALCSDRPYRPAWPPERVVAHLRALSGTHFDPQAVELFLRVFGDRLLEAP